MSCDDNQRLFSCPTHAMLTVAIAIKLIAEIALLALFGQWALGAVTGAKRARNPFHALLQLLGRPWMRAARWLSPRAVLDRHVPWVAIFLLLLVWGLASFAKVALCLQTGVNVCQ
jgi:hypothetical protein